MRSKSDELNSCHSASGLKGERSRSDEFNSCHGEVERGVCLTTSISGWKVKNLLFSTSIKISKIVKNS